MGPRVGVGVVGSDVVGLRLGMYVGLDVRGVHMSPRGKHCADGPRMDVGQWRAFGQGMADRLELHSDTASVLRYSLSFGSPDFPAKPQNFVVGLPSIF